MYEEPYPQEEDLDEADWWKNPKSNKAPVGDNHPTLPEKSKTAPTCPKCGSYFIVTVLKRKRHKHCCQTCGNYWRGIPELEERKKGKPISWDDILDFRNELNHLPAREGRE